MKQRPSPQRPRAKVWAAVFRTIASLAISMMWFVANMNKDISEGIVMGFLFGIGYWFTLPKALLAGEIAPSKIGIITLSLFVICLFIFGFYMQAFDHPILQITCITTLLAASIAYNFFRKPIVSKSINK